MPSGVVAAKAGIRCGFLRSFAIGDSQMTTSQEARGTTTLVAPEQARGLLTEAQRKALVAALDKEFWQRVRGQCSQRPWPGRLQAWDVSPEGRVLAGVMTGRAMVWLDAGPLPVADEQDPRLAALLADRRAREALWKQGRRSWTPPQRR
jgi:hypothetical protein